MNVYDVVFARRMTEVFEADLAKARRITYEEWQRRPLRIRLRERALSLLQPVL